MNLRRTPLKRKRETPRRNEGRVKHGRMKPKATDYTAMEEFHVERLRKLPCCVDGCHRKSIVHHLMKTPPGFPKRCRRDHRYSANVCDHHHNGGNDSVHLLGSEERFKEVHGIDLFEVAMHEWEVSAAAFERA